MLLSGVPAAAALCFAALCPVFFLNADKTQPTPVLSDNPRALNSLCEPLEQLLERLRILYFNTHARSQPSLLVLPALEH
jgi:hypothetical protein